MSWTDKEIKHLKSLREETDLDWKEITEEMNAQFSEKRTLNATRKAFRRFQDDEVSDDVLIKNIKSTFTAKQTASKLRKENKAIVEENVGLDNFLDSLSSIVGGMTFKQHKKVKQKKRKKIKRTIIGHISDTHIGINIDKVEMGGINAFNNEVSARRFAYFFRELAKYKKDHREETDLVLVLNGDIFAGVIHGQEGAVDLMSTQFAAALSIFTQGISYIATEYRSIRIECQTGNHCRYIHKDNKGRQTEQKWDSFATNLYVSLKQVFRKDKHIEFVIPETPYSLFKVFDHNFLATHGDTFINLGNPGKSINTKDITSQINSVSTGLGVKIDVILGAHVHKSTHQTLDNGTDLLINGTLSGTDPFAQSIGITGSHPSQQIIEVTEEHRVGDVRFVQLKGADNEKELDGIIEPMLGKF